MTTVTYYCVLSVKTWCGWAIGHEKLDRDKASQPEQACRLSQCEVQPPMMITMIDGQQLISGTPNAEEPIDIEVERIADPGNRNNPSGCKSTLLLQPDDNIADTDFVQVARGSSPSSYAAAVRASSQNLQNPAAAKPKDLERCPEDIYHEKQVRANCQVHSLNAFFGGKVFMLARFAS